MSITKNSTIGKKMKKNNLNFTTKIINAKPSKKDINGALSTPIYRNAAFEFSTSEEIANAFQNLEDVPSHTYSRISNPSVEDLEKKITAASSAQQVQIVSSGMAAVSNTFLALCYSGCNIVTSPHLFGNTFSLFQFTLAAFGVETRFVDTDDVQQIENAIDENTVAFFCELITNPHMEVVNVEAVSKLLKSKKVPFIVDTTLIPWCGFKQQNKYFDIEVVSTTKYVSGGATSLGGAIIDYGAFDWSNNKRLIAVKSIPGISSFMFKIKREVARNVGAQMEADSAYQQSLGMETLALRYKQMSENAYQLALFLEQQSAVLGVNYTKLESSKYKKLSDSLFSDNPGAMLTFNLLDKKACYKFQDNLTVIHRSTNLFDNKTLIIHPESTIYGTFSLEMKQKMAIQDNLLRLSVGIENIEDLKEDIIRALSNL